MRTLVVAAIGAFVGMAVSQLFRFALAATPVAPTETTLVDSNGVVRFRVWVDDANDVRLGLFDKDGVRRAGISILKD